MLFAVFSLSFTKRGTSFDNVSYCFIVQRGYKYFVILILLFLLQISTVTLQKRIQLLSPDLRKLADDMLQSKLFNMGQFHFSQETHLNTVLIAGLLCHVAVLLLYAEDNGFLKPLTLIHYDPSALRDKYLPTIVRGTPSVLNDNETTPPTRAKVR